MLTLAAALGLAGVATATVLQITILGPGNVEITARVEIEVTDPTGIVFSGENSRDGEAILIARNLVPGESKAGFVTIRNKGLLTGRYTVEARDLVDHPGPNGGVLSSRIVITVDDVSAVPAKRIYSGPLASFGLRQAGIIRLNQTRTYRFVATMPPGGAPPSLTTGDNAFQSAESIVTFRWTGTECVLPCLLILG